MKIKALFIAAIVGAALTTSALATGVVAPPAGAVATPRDRTPIAVIRAGEYTPITVNVTSTARTHYVQLKMDDTEGTVVADGRSASGQLTVRGMAYLDGIDAGRHTWQLIDGDGSVTNLPVNVLDRGIMMWTAGSGIRGDVGRYYVYGWFHRYSTVQRMFVGYPTTVHCQEWRNNRWETVKTTTAAADDGSFSIEIPHARGVVIARLTRPATADISGASTTSLSTWVG